MCFPFQALRISTRAGISGHGTSSPTCLSFIRLAPHVWGRPTLTRETGSECSMSKSTRCNVPNSMIRVFYWWIPFSELGTTEMWRGARDLRAMTDGQSWLWALKEFLVSIKTNSGTCRHQCLLSVGNGDGGTNPNYLVVATDYTSYAIVYSCAEKLFLGKKGEILSFKLIQLVL